MSKQRSIDPRVWQHKAFLRSPWHCRDVFLYLFSAAADDEGRFEWEPLSILEKAFPRSYPVDEADIEGDLSHLVNEGLLVRYGNGNEYGFATGWFEHQYIQADRRTPSSFPEPPVTIPSWCEADAVRKACADALGRRLQQVTYHDAIDWFTGRERSVNGALTERSPEVEVEVEVEGESKGNDSASPSANAGSEQPKSARKPRDQKPAAEDTPAQAAIRRCYEAVFGAGAVPGGSKYSSLAKLYQEHGEDVFRKLADHIRGREQPEGTEQNAWFAKLVREELSAKWKWIEDTGPDKRRGAFIRLRDGASYAYEADWSFGQQYEVNAQRERGNWNEVTGCTKTPANGFCCDDGYFYPTGQERERWAA